MSGREFSVVINVNKKAIKQVCDPLVFSGKTFDNELNPKNAF